MTAHETTTLIPPKISKLPEDLINQIAAGEVVERPSSVVKELVENSIDAGSTQVEIRLVEGGLTSIQVIDNGCGIPSHELGLASERHATSKLARFTDLEQLNTFGFRGEALASIASISEMEITSRPHAESKAGRLTLAYGEAHETILPAASPAGTQIVVNNLFGRVPARKKFLRTAGTEFSHCAKVIKEIALGNPAVTFKLFHNDRLIQAYQTSTRLGRFQECFRVDWNPFHFEASTDDLHAEAFTTPAGFSSDRGDLLIILNGRPIRNRPLVSAVRNAYTAALGPHHEPSGVLFLDVRSDWVDVNVHPQKLEVRLLKQESCYQWLMTGLRDQLTRTRTLTAALPNLPLHSPSAPYSLSSPPVRHDGEFWEEPESVAETTRQTNPPAAFMPVPETKHRWLGKLKNRYLVFTCPSGLRITSAHALHEQMIYQQLSNGPGQALKGQALLIPRIATCPVEVAAKIEKHKELLKTLGMDVDCFGDGDIAIRSRPDRVAETDLENFFREVIKDFPDREMSSTEIDGVLKKIACRMAVRSVDQLTPLQWDTLVKFAESADSLGCAHEPNAVFNVSLEQLDKHIHPC